jgi:putative transposase
MDKFLSINEARNLLGITDRAIRKNCNSGKYEVRQVKGNGGMRYEIALNSLPKEAQDRYQKTHLTQVAEQVSALLETPKTDLVIPQVDLFELSDRQREIARNRETILRFVADSGLKIRAALTYLNTGWALGSLPSALQYALENSFDKRHPQQLKERTYWSWVAEKQQRGDSVPQKRNRDFSVKPWHYMALELYRRPQKPTVQFVVEKLAEAFDPAPTYRQVDYFFSMKFSQSELLKGRNAGMALRALQYHKKRTAAGMLPWDELHADGWASHFTAPHPVTGEYVTYELWDVHDVATRYIPPFAIGLTENYEVIAKAVENAIRDNGIMAILQTDSTKIVKKNVKFVGNPVLSIAERAGITIVHPKTVGNAQANGIAENFHAWLDKK